MTAEATPAARKPRVAIMGEFSAGKSTLTNLLLGARPLPERITATRLSPVWIAKGTDGPRRVFLDGKDVAIDRDAIADVPVEDTRMIRMYHDAPLLDLCDVVDFPGISDPNMDSEVWERLLPEMDMILWCTHATQAWRQSEAAAWDLVPEEVRARSILLVTRFDKLVTERDRARVLGRLEGETEGLFSAMFPVSLLQALEGGKSDPQVWTDSGAEAFTDALLPAIKACAGEAGLDMADDEDDDIMAGIDDVAAAPVEEIPVPEHLVGKTIVPRRIRPRAGSGRRQRPADTDASDSDAMVF